MTDNRIEIVCVGFDKDKEAEIKETFNKKLVETFGKDQENKEDV